MKFHMIASIKYRDPTGDWHSIGKVGAKMRDTELVQAYVYLNALYIGHCFAFPFGDEFPYLHGHIVGHDGGYEEGGEHKTRWINCGFIHTHEIDASDYKGEERYGNRMYRIRLDAIPVRLMVNTKGAIVLPVQEEQ